MKRYLVVAAAALTLSACSGTVTTQPDGTTKVDLTVGKIETATHNDLVAAAKYAQDHGYPERAAVWLAHDAHLTAVEVQISACANAITADLAARHPTAGGGGLSPFLAVEMAAEAVGNFTGPSAKTKILCAPFPLVRLPVLPHLP